MVYSISNHDPKEYLPLIAKFETYEPTEYRNYKIDLHLKHYDRALQELIKCSPFSDYSKEIFDLIEQKHLYETAIKLFKSNASLNQYLNQIYSIYGDYLLVKKYFNEALIVFKKGENYQNAIKAAQIADNWNQILECSALAYKQSKDINKSNGDQEQLNLNKTFQTIAEQLDTKENARNSSFIYGFYLNNWNQAMRVLIKNFKWADVYRLLINDICKNSTNQIESTDSINLDNIQSIKLNSAEIDELIDLADQTIQKHYEEIVDQLNELLDELKKYTERLQKVRENKLNLIRTMNQADNLNDLEDEFLNDQSTISSINSLESKRRAFRHKQSSNQSQTNSLKTNRAARKKKKAQQQQQNQYRLKEGSRDEDLALIFHIRKCIKKIERLKKTIKLLIFTLSNRKFDDLAFKLQLQFDKLLKVSEFVRSFVWQVEQNETEYLPDEINVNSIQDVNLQKPPKIIDVDWKLIFFEN